MDVLREVEKPPLWRRKWLAIPALVIPVAVFIGTSSFGNADYVVDSIQRGSAVITDSFEVETDILEAERDANREV